MFGPHNSRPPPPFGWCTPTSTVFPVRTASPILTPPAHSRYDIRNSSGQGGSTCRNKSVRSEPFAEKSEGKPVPPAGDTSIKSSFARRLLRKTRHSLRDAPIATIPEASIKILEKCFGCSALLVNAAYAPRENRSMPLTRWAHYRQTRIQKKKALHLLALSGVVRPSTIELRYTAPPSPISDEQTPIEQDAAAPAISTVRMHSAETTHLAHHLYSAAFMFLAKSRRHIQSLQWDIRNAA